ncbi:unnamed protein product, partial [marine sediment metagenome]
REWYNDGKNPKVIEIVEQVERVASLPVVGTKAEHFTQGVLFGFFLTSRGYIKEEGMENE